MTDHSAADRTIDSTSNKIKQHQARIGIIGLGYVGLPLALLYTEQKFPVTGFDIDERKVTTLARAVPTSTAFRPPRFSRLGRRASPQPPTIRRSPQMDAIIICVPTPLNEYHEPDLSYITDTAIHCAASACRATGRAREHDLSRHHRRSDDPDPGKGQYRGPQGSARGAPAGQEFFVAFSPEREDPGNNTVARRDIPKVVGGLEPAGFRPRPPPSTEPSSTAWCACLRPAAAEMTKLLENIYRCVNIALVNELKMLSLRMGIDIWEVIDAASTKPFGFHPFYPGPGLGGHCIPVDPFYLSWKAKEWDFRTRFIELAGEINTNMPYHVIESVTSALNRHKKAINGSKVLVLGVAYKKDIDDLRESPALTIIELLQKEGAQVSYNDPLFPDSRQGPQIRPADDLRAAG